MLNSKQEELEGVQTIANQIEKTQPRFTLRVILDLENDLI